MCNLRVTWLRTSTQTHAHTYIQTDRQRSTEKCWYLSDKISCWSVCVKCDDGGYCRHFVSLSFLWVINCTLHSLVKLIGLLGNLFASVVYACYYIKTVSLNWIRNWSHCYSCHCCCCSCYCSCWGDHLLKSQGLRHFKSDRDEIWWDCCPSKYAFIKRESWVL